MPMSDLNERITKLPKWARDHITETEKKLAVAAAFHRTAPVIPDVPPPEFGVGIVNGWSINAHNCTYYKSCSSSIGHGIRRWDKTTSQNPIHQYSTESMAKRALRWHAEEKAAEMLWKIDNTDSEMR